MAMLRPVRCDCSRGSREKGRSEILNHQLTQEVSEVVGPMGSLESGFLIVSAGTRERRVRSFVTVSMMRRFE